MKTTLEELEQLFKLKDDRQIKKALVNKITALDAKNIQVKDEPLKELIAQFRNHGAYDVQEACKAYNITEQTLKQFATHKIISSYQLVSEAGSKLLFLKSELEKENHLMLIHSEKADRMKIARLTDKLAALLMENKTISPRYYLVFKMYYFEDNTKEEISKKFNITLPTVKIILESAERRMLYALASSYRFHIEYIQWEAEQEKERREHHKIHYDLCREIRMLKKKLEKLTPLKKNSSRKEVRKVLEATILDSTLSEQVQALCLANDITTVSSLLGYHKKALQHRGFDNKSIREIETFFKKLGLSIEKEAG